MKEEDLKGISYLKGFLTRKKEEVINLHFEKGISVQQICMELGNKYSKELFYPNGHTLRMKPTIPNHILNILGYSDWEIYKKTLPKLISKARYKHGFTQKLKKEILEKYNYSCMKCGKSEKLEVHHKDRNPLNNEKDNLILLCIKCHQAITLGKIPSNHAKKPKKIPKTLIEYSNWLELKGIAIKDIINNKRNTQILAQAFIREVRKNLNLTKKQNELLIKFSKGKG